MHVSSLLGRSAGPKVWVSPESPVAEAARLMAARGIGAVPVRDAAGRLVGVLSERDIVRVVAVRAAGIRGLPVAEVMTQDAVTAQPETPVVAAIAMMESRQLRHLPVCAPDGSLLGMVGLGDLALQG